MLRVALAQASAPARPTTNTTDDLPRRLERTTRLAHVGELSAARQALTSEPLAPPTEATLQQLTDPSRRPAEPYRPLPQDILDAAPAVPLALDRTALLANLRRARRGAAPGPSGYTAEILRLVLDEEDASQLFFEVASLLARAHVPESAGAREAWWLVTFCDGSLPGPLHNSSPPISKPPATPTSMPSPRGPVPKRSCIPCRRALRPTRA